MSKMIEQRVEIVTRSVANPDEAPLRMIIETTNVWHRNWLNKHTDWAVRTGRSVAIYPTDAAVTFVTVPLDTSRRDRYHTQTRSTKRPDRSVRAL